MTLASKSLSRFYHKDYDLIQRTEGVSNRGNRGTPQKCHTLNKSATPRFPISALNPIADAEELPNVKRHIMLLSESTSPSSHD